MISNFLNIQRLLNNNSLKVVKTDLNEVIKRYSFLYFDEKVNIDQQIFQKIKESKVIIIDHCQESNQGTETLYFIIGFKETLIMVKQPSISLLNPLFKSNLELQIYFLSDTKDIFDKSIKIEYKEPEPIENLKILILNFNDDFRFLKKNYSFINQTWNTIQSCISGYLIIQSYFKLFENRIKCFYSNENNSIPNKIIKNYEYVVLKSIGSGSFFDLKLIYIFKDEKLFILKMPYEYSTETPNLIEREHQNYLKISHPFLPKFYGITEEKFLIIEYINGRTLNQSEEFDEKEQYSIIFQLLSVIRYLHENHFIYRDLKPNNIMIDHNKNLVLIDFDRMISDDNDEDHTIDLNPHYAAPELEKKHFTNKCDIYSFGKILNYFTKESIEFKNIYEHCTNKNPDKRPSIIELIKSFYKIIVNKQNFIVLENIDPEDQYQLGLIYYYGEITKTNIDKSILYLKLAADHDHSDAQLALGQIYHDNINIKQDINQSIHYLELASNQNNSEAQFGLASIYYEGKYIKRDINKAIHYFSLASELGCLRAQYQLGLIYYEGEYVNQNIEKAIHYFSIASDHNYSKAQFQLGLIYYEGKYKQRNIEKAIYYFSLASNQNHLQSHNYLAGIYLDGKYVKPDYDKFIHYFTLAADQNDDESQFFLGFCYYKGEYVKKDVNKAIHYLSLSSQQNNTKAHFYLGFIYYEGISIKQDIKKALYFFTLAARNNYVKAYFYLGLIFYEGKYIQRDINQAIYLFKIASNQNNLESQFYLGFIYYSKKYIQQDLDLAIHYFTLSANQNYLDSQFFLGKIYLEKKDINKSIYYFKLAADQNDAESQFILGLFYYENKYLKVDINKSIHYFTLAANQNHARAQIQLGLIYYLNEYKIVRDVNKSIYYYKLAAEQNDPNAQFCLGSIYYDQKDLNQSIHYLKLASNNDSVYAQVKLGIIYCNNNNYKEGIYYLKLASDRNSDEAQYLLGYIYWEGKIISKDINKSIHYLTLASNRNHSKAQYLLALIYKNDKKNMNKIIDLIMQSSKNGNYQADFSLGFFYHEGKQLNRDIQKSLKFYKNASSFNEEHAKNNLGILYKNGFDEIIQKNLKIAKMFLKESIKQKNNKVSKYNLAHIYLFDDNKFEKSIQLAFESANQNFIPSLDIIIIALIKLYGNDATKICNEIEKKLKISFRSLNSMIKHILSDYPSNFEKIYKIVKKIDFLYDYQMNLIKSKELYDISEKNEDEINPIFNINSDFYEGFGYDILQR